jgi:hypothetical protein
MKFKKKDIKYFLDLYKKMGVPKVDAEDNLKKLMRWVEDLPKKIILYRIIFVNSEDEIIRDRPGSHYMMDKEHLIDTHYINIKNLPQGSECYLLTVEADKKMIDQFQTIATNIVYPSEKEITLKNKGEGINYIEHKKINE